MGAKEDVMGWYCLVTFASASVLFCIRQLLLKDASNSRISKAAEYVPAVEVSVPLSDLLSGVTIDGCVLAGSVFSTFVLLELAGTGSSTALVLRVYFTRKKMFFNVPVEAVDYYWRRYVLLSCSVLCTRYSSTLKHYRVLHLCTAVVHQYEYSSTILREQSPLLTRSINMISYE